MRKCLLIFLETSKTENMFQMVNYEASRRSSLNLNFFLYFRSKRVDKMSFRGYRCWEYHSKDIKKMEELKGSVGV